MKTLVPLHTPLRPAGHLPLKGGDWPAACFSPIANVQDQEPWRVTACFSPSLRGEDPGVQTG